MDLDSAIQDAVGDLVEVFEADPERTFEELDYKGAARDPAVTVAANAASTFPEADERRGVKVGAEVLVIDGKPFADASKDLKAGRWRLSDGGGSGVDLEITGLVTGDTTVGYTVTINPKGASS